MPHDHAISCLKYCFWVNARPRPREAPVMSHTFDINPLSAVHGKIAAEETVNRAIFF